MLGRAFRGAPLQNRSVNGAPLQKKELRAGLRQRGSLLFSIFSARLKSCPFKDVVMLSPNRYGLTFSCALSKQEIETPLNISLIVVSTSCCGLRLGCE